MTTAALALIAAIAALVAVIGGAALARRSNRAAASRLDECLRAMSTRMDGLAEELASSVKRAQEDAVRARILASLGGALDLAEVLTRCAEAAESLPGVAAAAVTVEVDGAPMIAAVGVDADTVSAMVGPPGPADPRAIGLSYHYREGRPTGAFLSAVAVPIASRETRLGFLTVYGDTEEPPVSGAAFQTLEAIAELAGPAIEKAQRREHGDPADVRRAHGARQPRRIARRRSRSRSPAPTARAAGSRSACSTSTASEQRTPDSGRQPPTPSCPRSRASCRRRSVPATPPTGAEGTSSRSFSPTRVGSRPRQHSHASRHRSDGWPTRSARPRACRPGSPS